MASFIPGFEYDIFISYRQKDNKYDGWVTEFVDNLKKELEATFKEDITVYFDINPHDGLLETHDVSASLNNKLKCLVFIPIISRTYCDPKSFAWEHEFKAFVEAASQDQYGMKVKLPNGNVAGRVLPVRIHDLDNEDIHLCESLLGGVLRGVEFIYKSAGVNRPLRSTEEKPNDNLNRTIYRDQINKVALAIKEIFSALDPHARKAEGARREVAEPVPAAGNSIKTKLILSSVVAVSLLLLAYLFIPKLLTTRKETEKSIAVLPFINDSPDQANGYFINGLMEEILNNLQRIKEFTVLSRTSTMQFSGTDRPTIPEIAEKLKVNYIVEGSGQKYGDKFVLRVQLIAAKNETHLWGESFEQEINEVSDIIRIQSKIAEAIASELKATITPEEKQKIEKIPTTNLTAYDFYQRGIEELYNFLETGSLKSLERTEELSRRAMENDSAFAAAYVGLAYVYLWKSWIYSEKLLSINYLDTVMILTDKALSYDSRLPEAYFSRAIYYNSTGHPEKAIKEFEKAIKYNPNYILAYEWLGKAVYMSSRYYSDYVKGLECLHKAASLTQGQELPGILNALAYGYTYQAGFPEMGKKYFEELLKLTGDTALYITEIGTLEMRYGDFDKGLEKSLQAYSMNSNGWGLGLHYFYDGNYKESFKYWAKTIDYYKSSGRNLQGLQNLFGYLLWQNGFKKEAEYWFNDQMKLSQESIKLGRYYSTSSNGSRNAYFDLAALYAFRGEKEKALDILKTFDRCPVISRIMLTEIKSFNPLFNTIRDDSEFQEIVKSWEAKYQAEHERVRKWLEEKEKL